MKEDCIVVVVGDEMSRVIQLHVTAANIQFATDAHANCRREGSSRSVT